MNCLMQQVIIAMLTAVPMQDGAVAAPTPQAQVVAAPVRSTTAKKIALAQVKTVKADVVGRPKS